jgi:hypothetical protein
VSQTHDAIEMHWHYKLLVPANIIHCWLHFELFEKCVRNCPEKKWLRKGLASQTNHSSVYSPPTSLDVEYHNYIIVYVCLKLHVLHPPV